MGFQMAIVTTKGAVRPYGRLSSQQLGFLSYVMAHDNASQESLANAR